jgi:Fe-S cluster assembly ATP-binding protein
MHIEIKDLEVLVNNKKVLNKLNLEINPGEIHVIMGPNGVGKSTLSKVLMGSEDYKVESGDILVDGKSIKDLETDERAKLGMFLSFQNPIDIEGVTNSEFLKVAINERREEPIGLYDFIHEMEQSFDELGLKKEMMHRSVNQNFSGGEKKKNEILQMKLLKPKFVILDELDSGLDVDSLKVVCDNVNSYLSDNPDTSVLMITHYQRILDYIKPDYIHILTNGHIVKTGDATLAKEIEEKGYKSFDNCVSLVSED